jgi:hypothetical protein
MPVYAFLCACGWNGDVRTTFDANNVECPECSKPTVKEAVYRVNFGGFATPELDLSREYKAFDEASQEIAYKSDRAGVDPPPLVQAAKAITRDFKRKGGTIHDLS